MTRMRQILLVSTALALASAGASAKGPYVPPFDAVLIGTGMAQAHVGTNAALQAYTSNFLQSVLSVVTPTTVRRDGFYQAGDGGGADYTYSSIACQAPDNGAQVTAASGGCWIIVPTNTYNPRQWGAKSDGSDSTAALQSALNSSVLTYGGTLRFDSGVYAYTSITIPDGIHVIGATYGSTVLETLSATADGIILGNATTLEYVKLASSATRTAGSFVKTFANSATLRHAICQGYFLCFTAAGATPGNPSVNPVVDDVQMVNPATGPGSGGLLFVNYSNASVDHIVGDGLSTGQQPDFGIKFVNGDTAFVANTNITLHGAALDMAPGAGQNIYGTHVVNSLFDSARIVSGGNQAPSCSVGGAGNVFETVMSNVWCGLSGGADGMLVNATGSGVVQGLHIATPQFDSNAGSGLHVGQGVTDWDVTGGSASGNGLNGIFVSGPSYHFSIEGIKAQPTAAGRPTVQANGVNISSGSDYYNVRDVDGVGVSGSPIIDGGTGTHGFVNDNQGYNGLQTLGLTAAASPWVVPIQHYPTTEYITGGSGIGVSLNSNTVCTATPCTVHRGPNQAMTIFYSSAPTVTENRE